MGMGFSSQAGSEGSRAIQIQQGSAYSDGKWKESRVEIGKGAFAIVKLATKKDSGRVAVKRIDKRKLGFKEQQHVRDEVAIMNKLAEAGSCPHIVQLIEVYESASHLDLVLEYVDAGQLLETLVYRTEPYTESTVSCCVRQVALGLKHMHSHSIGHFDLKPANLVLSSENAGDMLPILKLVDFGLSQVCDPKTGCVLPPARGPVGTISYVAPEVLSGSGKYGISADIWSLGVILFLLLSGTFPHFDEDDAKYLSKIMTSQPTWPDPMTWSAEAKDLVEKMLVVRPEDRLSVEDVLEVGTIWICPGLPVPGQ